MTLAPVISPTGIIAPTYAQILASLQDSMRSIYGSDIYLDPDSQDGQMLSIIASAIHDSNDAVIAAYNSFSPVTAQGVGLSSLVKLNGIRRLVATNSEAIVRIVGAVGTEINSGQVADQVGNRWALPALVIIPNAGQIDVTATAVDVGTIAASPNTITNIVTPTRGWRTVTNPAAATPGAPIEDDATLRQRQASSTSIPALSTVDAILGSIKNLVGVVRAFIYENVSGTTDGNGLPGHSISAVVQGGDAQTIANTIALYKTPGTGTYGTTSETVIDPMGIPSTINFFQLTLVNMSVLVNLTALTGYVTTTADLIGAAVAAWFNSLAVGQDSALNKLWSPVNLTGDAATDGTGLTQAQLDVFGATYNATSIYQARPNMNVTGGPYVAGTTDVAVADASNYAIGKSVAIILDNGIYLLTRVDNLVGLTVTLHDAVPVARSIPADALLFVAGDVVVAFNEAAVGDASRVPVVAT